MVRPIVRGSLALLTLFALPTAALAQRVSVTPLIGVYAPTENLYESKPGQSSGTETYKLDSGTSYGGAVGLWISPRVGFTLSGTVVPTSLRRARRSGAELTEAKLTQASMQAVFLLASETAIFVPYINGGFGMVSRGGDAFSASAETSSLTGIFGAGTAVRLGMLSLSVGAEVIDYSATYDLTGGPARQFTQRDVQFRVGLGTIFGGR
ncbi:MAG TPA: hypothetical protein VMK53_04165 [Gemmatimonadales bacterium]|nr:hypothetical protein [Gemmatimonadales bacterium]